MSFNGAAVLTGAGSLPIGITSAFIGAQGSSGATNWNGYITDIAIWASTRIPNAGLIAGTTP